MYEYIIFENIPYQARARFEYDHKYQISNSYPLLVKHIAIIQAKQ